MEIASTVVHLLNWMLFITSDSVEALISVQGWLSGVQQLNFKLCGNRCFVELRGRTTSLVSSILFCSEPCTRSLPDQYCNCVHSYHNVLLILPDGLGCGWLWVPSPDLLCFSCWGIVGLHPMWMRAPWTLQCSLPHCSLASLGFGQRIFSGWLSREVLEVAYKNF